MSLFAFGALCPWLSMLDPQKYGRFVDTVQGLDITNHLRPLSGDRRSLDIERAFYSRIRELPGLDPPALPDQSVLDQVIAATSRPLP